MAKILITTSSFDTEIDILNKIKSQNVEIVNNPYKRKLKDAEVSELLSSPDLIGLIAGTENLSEQTMKNATELKVVSRCGIGISNVDKDFLNRKGIQLFNTPDAPSLAVAELTVSLILSLIRSIPQHDSLMKSGEWSKHMGRLLYQKTVGVLGYGRIGKLVSERLKVFGCEVIAYDPVGVSGFAKEVSFDELVKSSDIISLHLPFTEETDNIVDADFLHNMKEEALLINTSRGELVDEEALYTALRSKKILGAALDVYKEEPYSGPLTSCDNVILTPHIGSYALEARARMEQEAAHNLYEGLKQANLVA